MNVCPLICHPSLFASRITFREGKEAIILYSRAIKSNDPLEAVGSWKLEALARIFSYNI